MTQLILATGETCTVVLDGLASGGYQWEHTVEGDGAAIKLTEERTDGRPAEGSLPQTYESRLAYLITAVKPGRANLRFFLHRVWSTLR